MITRVGKYNNFINNILYGYTVFINFQNIKNS